MTAHTAVSPISGLPVRQERLSALFQGLILLLIIGGVATLITFAGIRGGAWHVVSFSIYGATLILLYGVSAAYHAAPDGRTKRMLKVLDHSMIYVVIAGTYTPFALVTLHGGWGWSLFGITWGLALAGIGRNVAFVGRAEWVSVLLYLAMGWLVLIAAVPLVQVMPAWGLFWLMAGGLAYTAGTLFFLWERLPYHHVIWHGFVLAGATCHYFAVLFHVLPQRA